MLLDPPFSASCARIEGAHREGHQHGASGMVAAVGRGVEQDQKPVADEPLERSLVLGDEAAQTGVVVAKKMAVGSCSCGGVLLKFADLQQLPDAELVELDLGGEGAAFNAIMKRYN